MASREKGGGTSPSPYSGMSQIEGRVIGDRPQLSHALTDDGLPYWQAYIIRRQSDIKRGGVAHQRTDGRTVRVFSEAPKKMFFIE